MESFGAKRQQFAALCVGWGVGVMLRILPAYAGLAVLAFGLLLYLFDYLKSKQLSARRIYGWMGVATVSAIVLIVGVPRLIIGPPLENRIVLSERYGGEWHSSNEFRIRLDNNAVLRNRFVEGNYYRFTPTVDNLTPRSALIGVILFLDIPAELDIKPTKIWRIAEITGKVKEYFAVIDEVPFGISMGIDESLFVRFPHPGKYPVRYTIAGRTTTAGLPKIQRQFVFELTE